MDSPAAHTKLSQDFWCPSSTCRAASGRGDFICVAAKKEPLPEDAVHHSAMPVASVTSKQAHTPWWTKTVLYVHPRKLFQIKAKTRHFREVEFLGLLCTPSGRAVPGGKANTRFITFIPDAH